MSSTKTSKQCPMLFGMDKNTFGQPNEGLHSIRLFDIAVVDLLLTFVFSYVVAMIIDTDVLTVFIALLFIGTLLHLYLGVDTTIAKLIKNLV